MKLPVLEDFEPFDDVKSRADNETGAIREA